VVRENIFAKIFYHHQRNGNWLVNNFTIAAGSSRILRPLPGTLALVKFPAFV
jgi:hypothetical protein